MVRINQSALCYGILSLLSGVLYKPAYLVSDWTGMNHRRALRGRFESLVLILVEFGFPVWAYIWVDQGAIPLRLYPAIEPLDD